MTIDLSAEEMELVLVQLRRRIDELAFEIHHTDKRNYRDELKQGLDTLEKLVKRMEEREPVPVL